MVSLQASAGIAEGKTLFSLLFLKAGAMFVEKDAQAEKKRPEANNGSGPHQLVVVGTQQVFDVLEEDLDVPADGEDVDHVGIEQGGPPVASHLAMIRIFRLLFSPPLQSHFWAALRTRLQ